MRQYAIIMLIAILLLVTGCASANNKPTTIGKEYPGNIENVSQITIFNGSTGGKKEITEPSEILPWIEQIKDITLHPDPDQEERDGFLYAISLYEGKNSKLTFSLGSIDETYYIVDLHMLDLTEQLFNDNE